jgi:hypothetical protein
MFFTSFFTSSKTAMPLSMSFKPYPFRYSPTISLKVIKSYFSSKVSSPILPTFFGSGVFINILALDLAV